MWQFAGSAGLGIAIWEPQHRSKGLGTEAMRLLGFYAFEVMNLHRLQLEVYEFNHKAFKSYKKIGFREVGRLRQATKIYNSYHDLITMDMLKNEIIYGQELDEHLTKHYRSLVSDS